MKRVLLAVFAVSSLAFAGNASSNVTTLEATLPQGQHAIKATFPNTLAVTGVTVESEQCPAVESVSINEKTVAPSGALDEVAYGKQITIRWATDASQSCRFQLKLQRDNYRNFQLGAAAPAAPAPYPYPQPYPYPYVYPYPTYYVVTYPVVYTPVYYAYPVYYYPYQVVTTPVQVIVVP